MRWRGLKPSPPAQPAKLLRRLYLDLIGLPPTVDEVNKFLRDPSDEAYVGVVEQLLASPRYGEKWARHWLDLARYSDSNGYQADQIRQMWAFRDWVIEAMNGDLPYDRFTVEQLAGDLLPNPTLSQRVATGFHRATTCNVEAGVDPEGNRTDQVIDRVNTTGTTWLGTTLECAQCHNHKYDPISQQEYYEIFSFFNNTPIEVKQEKEGSVQFNFYGPKMSLPVSQEREAQVSELQNRIQTLDERIESTKKSAKPKLKQLRQQKTAVEAALAKTLAPTTLVMQELAEKRDTALFIRGDFLNRGALVKANVPRALGRLPSDAPKDRLGFARWLVDPDHPLTARVAVKPLVVRVLRSWHRGDDR